jgi:histone deacetylase 1/2
MSSGWCAEYVDFLSSVTPDNQDEYMIQMRRFNLGPVGEADCPVFDCMFDYCATYSGGSVGGATLINQKKADIVLNWAGAGHHLLPFHVSMCVCVCLCGCVFARMRVHVCV